MAKPEAPIALGLSIPKQQILLFRSCKRMLFLQVAGAGMGAGSTNAAQATSCVV